MNIDLVPSSIRASDLQILDMALETRLQDLKRIEDSLDAASKEQSQKYEHVMKLLEFYGQLLKNTTSNHEAKFGELKVLISGPNQQSFILQKL